MQNTDARGTLSDVVTWTLVNLLRLAFIVCKKLKLV